MLSGAAKSIEPHGKGVQVLKSGAHLSSFPEHERQSVLWFVILRVDTEIYFRMILWALLESLKGSMFFGLSIKIDRNS